MQSCVTVINNQKSVLSESTPYYLYYLAWKLMGYSVGVRQIHKPSVCYIRVREVLLYLTLLDEVSKVK